MATFTLNDIQCGLCEAMGSLIMHRVCGIACNEDYYLDKAHRYFKYQWLKENVSTLDPLLPCGLDSDVDCMINAESP